MGFAAAPTKTDSRAKVALMVPSMKMRRKRGEERGTIDFPTFLEGEVAAARVRPILMFRAVSCKYEICRVCFASLMSHLMPIGITIVFNLNLLLKVYQARVTLNESFAKQDKRTCHVIYALIKI